jgi:carbon-monoxide dehydrogenase small subunit
MSDVHRVSVEVNGVRYERPVEARRLLVDFLREDLGLVGTHIGCEHGVCGTCTVLMDGESIRSCITFAVQADGHRVATVEGLASDGRLHPLQDAFWEQQGVQCGYCTPGMLLLAKELLERNPNPSREEVRRAIASNLCRCTGYQFIIDAILDAAARLRGEAAQPSPQRDGREGGGSGGRDALLPQEV